MSGRRPRVCRVLHSEGDSRPDPTVSTPTFFERDRPVSYEHLHIFTGTSTPRVKFKDFIVLSLIVVVVVLLFFFFFFYRETVLRDKRDD